jgi:DNA-binding NtrC family response regulator
MSSNSRRPLILIADDEPLYQQTTAELLRQAGFDCHCAGDANEAMAYLADHSVDLILSDLNMPGNMQLELLHSSRKQLPQTPLIVVTGAPSLPSAIESLRLGIADYLLKPVKFQELLASVRRALQNRERGGDFSGKAIMAGPNPAFRNIVGSSPPMLELFDVINRISQSDVNVLITGESGTGKEVVARTIHENSSRRSGRYTIVDCTAIPESLFESTLFGHVKGAFTGAIKDQRGLLAEADQGTVFFDEIGELPMPLQAKLLRVVQEQTFVSVGKTTTETVDTRFICATNRDLEVEVNGGGFRRDLFYRLAVVHIELPPLRDRGNDIVLLANHFLKTLKPPNCTIKGFSESGLERLKAYPWPGNIRELRNAIERSLALCANETIDSDDLPKSISQYTGVSNTSIDSAISREDVRQGADSQYLKSLLEKHAGNVTRAAEEANLSRQGLHKLMRKHGVSATDFRR